MKPGHLEGVRRAEAVMTIISPVGRGGEGDVSFRPHCLGAGFVLGLLTGAFSWRPALDDLDIVALPMGFDGETQACDTTAHD
jgi:hypothetical protein